MKKLYNILQRVNEEKRWSDRENMFFYLENEKNVKNFKL